MNGDNLVEPCESPPAKSEGSLERDDRSFETPPGAATLTSSSSSSSDDSTMMTPADREAKARVFVSKLGLVFDDLHENAKVRVKRLMSSDFTWTPTKPKTRESNIVEHKMIETTFREQYDLFCNRDGMDKWKDFSNVFFDKQALDDYLVIRRQRDGACFMHAAIVFVHYMSVLRSGHSNHEMLDMSTYIREHMDEKEQKQYIVQPVGGHAFNFMKTVTSITRFQCQPIILTAKTVSPKCHDSGVDFLLGLNEPLLVGGFLIENDFVPKTKTRSTDDEDDEKDEEKNVEQKISYTGSINTNDLYEHTLDDGTVLCNNNGINHSMLIIGAYKDKETGTVFFLLQNWWEGKYFIEVDSEYLASSDCQIFRILPNVEVALKEAFDTQDAPYAEGFSPIESCFATAREL